MGCGVCRARPCSFRPWLVDGDRRPRQFFFFLFGPRQVDDLGSMARTSRHAPCRAAGSGPDPGTCREGGMCQAAGGQEERRLGRRTRASKPNYLKRKWAGGRIGGPTCGMACRSPKQTCFSPFFFSKTKMAHCIIYHTYNDTINLQYSSFQLKKKASHSTIYFLLTK